MARRKLNQVQLVSADGTTQPPFPGGWVLAICEAANAFAPGRAQKTRLPGSARTHVRLKGGQPVKQSTYDEIEARLVDLVIALFPTVAVINDFAAKYVDEYFRLWRSAAEIAPLFIRAYGFQEGPSGVLSRALLRDLVLRLCYLESCERALRGQPFTKGEVDLLRHDSPAKVYDALIAEKAHRKKMSREKLAESLGLYPKKLQRLKTGKIASEWEVLRKLARADENHRVLAGIGFIDVLLRSLGLNGGPLEAEVMRIAEVLLPAHTDALINWDETQPAHPIPVNPSAGANQFAQFAAFGDRLLLHPRFEPVWSKLPDALWRTHVYSLKFACIVDLAQAYLQFGQTESDRNLRRFLDNAERESKCCPYHWIQELQKHSNVLPKHSTSIKPGRKT